MAASKFTQDIWKSPTVLIATGFGTGLLPGMPGTYASFLVVVVWWLVLADLELMLQLPIFIVTAVACFFATDVVVRRYKVEDEPEITSDEVVGQLLVLLLIPQEFWCVVLGFVAFRILDIWKPWIIGKIDRSHHGTLGIFYDDLLAAIGAVLFTLTVYFLWITVGIGYFENFT